MPADAYGIDHESHCPVSIAAGAQPCSCWPHWRIARLEERVEQLEEDKRVLNRMLGLSSNVEAIADRIESARVKELEDENAKLRRSVGNLEMEICEWQAATGLEDSSGDPGTITPANLEAEIRRLRAEKRATFEAGFHRGWLEREAIDGRRKTFQRDRCLAVALAEYDKKEGG